MSIIRKEIKVHSLFNCEYNIIGLVKTKKMLQTAREHDIISMWNYINEERVFKRYLL